MPTPAGVAVKLWATVVVAAAVWAVVVTGNAMSHGDAGAWILPIGFGPLIATVAGGYWMRWMAR